MEAPEPGPELSAGLAASASPIVNPYEAKPVRLEGRRGGWRQAGVLSEILSPPVSLRGDDHSF